MYRFDSGSVEWLAASGAVPVWLSDNRRLLFEEHGVLKLMDSRSREVREVLNVTPNAIGIFSISRDNRNIYVGLSVSEADIWLMNLP